MHTAEITAEIRSLTDVEPHDVSGGIHQPAKMIGQTSGATCMEEALRPPQFGGLAANSR